MIFNPSHFPSLVTLFLFFYYSTIAQNSYFFDTLTLFIIFNNIHSLQTLNFVQRQDLFLFRPFENPSPSQYSSSSSLNLRHQRHHLLFPSLRCLETSVKTTISTNLVLWIFEINIMPHPSPFPDFLKIKQLFPLSFLWILEASGMWMSLILFLIDERQQPCYSLFYFILFEFFFLILSLLGYFLNLKTSRLPHPPYHSKEKLITRLYPNCRLCLISPRLLKGR